MMAVVLLAGPGCSPPPGITEEHAMGLVTERDVATAHAAQLEAEVIAMKRDQLRLTQETEKATEEADELIASLMDEVDRKQVRIGQLTERLAEAEARDFADVIRLQDGQEVVCKVLDVHGNVVDVLLPDGSRKKARLADVQRVLLRSTGMFAVSREPTPVAEPPPTTPAETGGGRVLELSPFWNVPLPASTRTTQALKGMLEGYGRPQLDRDGRDGGAFLFQDITYLMPASAAQATLDQKNVQRTEVVVPGLPKNSLFTQEYSGRFGGKFNRLLLVTDYAAQVVAVQLVEDAPQGRWLDPNVPPGASKIYRASPGLFNIIENRSKSNARGLVGTRITRLDTDVIRIDSEFLSSQHNARECVRLYIAQPVIDLILLLIETYY